MSQYDHPLRLAVSPQGGIENATRRYEKHLGDMSGVYLDEGAWQEQVAAEGSDTVVYWVDEHKYGSEPGGLTIGTSTVLPGRVGEEFAVTRGHLHAIADRAELYHCLSGRGVMLLETVDGRSEAVELSAGQAVNVPGHWLHRSVNVGDEPFVTLFCYNSDAGQDYEIISRAGGMRNLIVAEGEGWAMVPNPRHRGYQGGADA